MAYIQREVLLSSPLNDDKLQNHEVLYANLHGLQYVVHQNLNDVPHNRGGQHKQGEFPLTDQHGSLCDVAIQRKFLRFHNEVHHGEHYGDVNQNDDESRDESHSGYHQSETIHEAEAQDDLSHEQSNAQYHDVADHEVTLVLSNELTLDESTHLDGKLAQSPDGILDGRHLHDEEFHEARQRNVLLHRDELE